METFVIVMVLVACIAAMAAAISSFISENFIAGALWTIIAILWGINAGFRISEKISNTEKAKIESVQYEKCPAIDSTILIHGTDTVLTYSIKYE